MEKILLISPVIPDANGGGREKRAHQWVNRLSRMYEVSILIINSEVSKDKEEKLLFNSVEKVDFIVIQPASKKEWFGALSSVLQLVTGNPKGLLTLLHEWIPLNDAIKHEVAALFKGKQFDLILCFRLYLKKYALYVKKITSAKTIHLDIDDIESSTRLKIGTLALKKQKYKRAFIYLLSSLLFRIEEKHMNSAAKDVYVCSNEDQSLLSKRYPNLNVMVMPNRIFGSPKSLPLLECPYQLLFVGSLHYFPNEEAVLWLVQKVLPRLRELDNRWALHVAGFGASEALTGLLLEQDGVRFHGYVESLEDVYQQAAIVVSPLHAGGGTKLKVLEAMWYGRPLIATYESVYGLGLIPDVHYLAAETADDFVNACQKIVQNSMVAKELTAASIRIMEENYIYE
ncbi:glycosyltransferase [Schinkia azotoformans MEV2011]|uniref:Glycosyltransferase n=1 Tax=Schinkia azotoformans MEV2011 TaxID=1348973 RepID=A0A072NR90_SCHAZ|nr:glycosyltransferase [Schinkia azotoformans]KEF39752.1 glycosyltransferase [Schinkia azotoformans MEV2011]MEC1695030.1 glycosyltransferase [Schinkia azotoformans]MEC1726835.1 glycosyltransferase [Schinkia azotoformans]MEC1772514.1 glycosyltransferase [Schinkia azotoformans]MEC1781910.1 glycosyltransferase [Schinkia azotoformans]